MPGESLTRKSPQRVRFVWSEWVGMVRGCHRSGIPGWNGSGTGEHSGENAGGWNPAPEPPRGALWSATLSAGEWGGRSSSGNCIQSRPQVPPVRCGGKMDFRDRRAGVGIICASAKSETVSPAFRIFGVKIRRRSCGSRRAGRGLRGRRESRRSWTYLTNLRNGGRESGLVEGVTWPKWRAGAVGLGSRSADAGPGPKAGWRCGSRQSRGANTRFAAGCCRGGRCAGASRFRPVGVRESFMIGPAKRLASRFPA